MYSPYYNSERVQDLQGFYKPTSTHGQYNYMGGANTNKFPYTSTTPVFNKFSPTGLTENPGMSFNQNSRDISPNPLLSNPTGSFNTNSKQFQPESPQVGGGNKPSAGGIANAAIAGGDIITDAINMGKEADAIQTKVPGIQYDSDGKPTYTMGQQYIDTAGIKPQGVTLGEYHSMTAKGMAAGAQVGGPWGALIGAVVGSGSALIGGRRRKKKMEAAKRKATNALTRRRDEYANSTEQYNENRLAQEAYQDRMNKQDRLYNLYNR